MPGPVLVEKTALEKHRPQAVLKRKKLYFKCAPEPVQWFDGWEDTFMVPGSD